jgi:hypothetical protein
MSTVERHTLNARAGDSFTRVITWNDDQGNPIDLTLATVEWSLLRGVNTEQWTTAPQVTITDALGGEITLALTFTETRTLRAIARTWLYEVTVEFPTGQRTTILEGSLLIAKELVE